MLKLKQGICTGQSFRQFWPPLQGMLLRSLGLCLDISLEIGWKSENHTLIYIYISQTMWNHEEFKNQMKRLKWPISLILQENVRSSVLKTALSKTKTRAR